MNKRVNTPHRATQRAKTSQYTRIKTIVINAVLNVLGIAFIMSLCLAFVYIVGYTEKIIETIGA